MPKSEAPFPPDVLLEVGPGFDDALRAMRDPAYAASQNQQAQQWRADRKGAHPDVLEFERVFVAKLSKLGVPAFAHCVVRTRDEQARLLALGRSNAQPRESPHEYGLAVDVVHSVRAWNLTRRQWEVMGHVGNEVAKSRGIKIEWGGDWRFFDPAHWQLAGWRSLQAGFPFSGD